jgi:hypothetical protein
VSQCSEITIACKGCGTTQPFTMWGVVNGALDRELKEKLLAGELTRFVCKECGWDGPVIHSLLYCDLEKRFICWLLTDPGDPNQVKNTLIFGPDYHLRVVSSRIALIEKILLFDANLDDRVIESVKLILPAHVGNDTPNAQLEFLFDSVGKRADGSEEIRFSLRLGDEDLTVCVEMDVYTTLKTRLAPIFQIREPGTWERVDSAFAVKLWA